jgi:hypothetical protein
MKNGPLLRCLGVAPVHSRRRCTLRAARVQSGPSRSTASSIV